MADLCDEVLKRAHFDEDDVLLAEVNEQDPFAYEQLEVDKLEFKYDRVDHSYPKLFALIVHPSSQEKQVTVVLKIIDGLLRKEIPQILNFFIFRSLKRKIILGTLDRSERQRVLMQPIEKIRSKFLEMFPLANEYSST